MTPDKKLTQVMEKQDIETLEAMIQNGTKLSELNLYNVLVNFINSKEKVDTRFIKSLIENGIKLDYNSKKQNTDVMLLSYLGLDEILDDLISKGFDINATNTFSINAFHWAVAGGQYTTVKLLMEKGVDIYAKLGCNVRIQFSTDDKLIANKDQAPKFKKVLISAFTFAFNLYNPKIIRLLLEKGFDPNEKVLKENGFFDFLKSWPLGENDLMFGWTDSMNIAIEHNDTEIAELLLSKGFDIQQMEFLNTNFEVLFASKNLKMIMLLIEAGLDVNQGNFCGNLLELCVEQSWGSNDKKSFEIAKYLIKKGANVNIGEPLMRALKTKPHNDINYEIAELLIQNGADVNYIDNTGKNILMEACIGKLSGAYDLIKLLIAHGADINHKDKMGNTALMMISISLEDESKMLKVYDDGTAETDYSADVVLSAEKIMHFLIDNGADINARNNMGMTPLMQYSHKGEERFVKILIERGADINAKSEMTAFDLTQNEEIKELIQKAKNNSPQKLVKLLSNFTIDKPIKYTTHNWDFGELKKEYGDFDAYMNAVKKQFEDMESEIKVLSPNLYKKIHTFLLEDSPDTDYSWCSKTPINIGWSSLEGLKEHCDEEKNPFDFKLQEPQFKKPLFIGRKQIATFGEVINLFKQEIEIRADFKNLEEIFLAQNIPSHSLDGAKLHTRQFYTDTQKFSSVLARIFDDMKRRADFKNIKVSTRELEDRSIEIKLTQLDSFSNKNAKNLLDETNDGDFAEIKASLANLCDWSVESSFEDENFRINYLHSNNVKDIEILDTKPKGFTHIFRFYK